MIDFLREYYRCDVAEALQKISVFGEQTPHTKSATSNLLKTQENDDSKNITTQENIIQIISEKQPITDRILLKYLKKRRIDLDLASKCCQEIVFKLSDREKCYQAIGFQNTLGGYELRNNYFKGSSSPKFISYINNQANDIAVFEGFFDFLSYQTIQIGQQQERLNFLVLNSLSFF